MSTAELRQILEDHFSDRIQLGTMVDDVSDIAGVLGVSAVAVATEVNRCALDAYAEVDDQREAEFRNRKAG